MPTKLLFQSARSSFAAQVDAAAGIIHGVSVITEGPALGHGLMIDSTTLAQIKDCAEQYQGGLKVKMNHGGGADAIIGYLTGFAINGNKLVADFHLLKTAPQRAYVLELATTIPDTFGMSVAFSGMSEEINGVYFARCDEIYSCDLVSEPAANPSGLFSRRSDEWAKNKGQSAPESSTHSMENDLLKKIGELIDSKLAAVSANFDAKLAELNTANATALSKIEEVSKLSSEAADKAALAAVKEFGKTLGQPAGAAAAPSAPPAAPVVKSFEVLVKEHPKYATAKGTAIAECIKQFGTEYREYLGRVQSGKDIIIF